MTREEFWDQFHIGATGALGGGPAEPFGSRLRPSMPQLALRKIEPITLKDTGA